jgi:hypothetical protein
VVLRSTERTGVLIVRAWIEPNAGRAFRARITRTLDVASREESVTAAATPEDVTRVLNEWLEAFLLAASDEVTEQ